TDERGHRRRDASLRPEALDALVVIDGDLDRALDQNSRGYRGVHGRLVYHEVGCQIVQLLAIDDADQGVRDHRGEVAARADAELLEGDFRRERAPVGAIARHGVEGVTAGDDPGRERDVRAAQSIGVPGPVVALVAGPHQRANAGQEAAAPGQQRVALE